MVRTGAFFGPWDEHNFVTRALARSRRRAGVVAAAATSQSRRPTCRDLVDAALDLLIDGETGLVNLASAGVSTAAQSWSGRRSEYPSLT